MSTNQGTIDTYDSKRLPPWLLGVFCLLPAIHAVLAELIRIRPVWTYPLMKATMIVMPIVVWRVRRWSLRSVGAATGFKPFTWWGGFVGAIMAAVILVGYYLFFRGWLDGGPLMAKIHTLGLGGHYLMMALMISFWNSLYEEYYWRGFLLSELRTWIPKPVTVWCVGAGLFGLHHILALLPLFAWPHVMIFTGGTMVAGGVWTWMRLRGDSVLDCYTSHIMADLAIMWIGWDLLVTA